MKLQNVNRKLLTLSRVTTACRSRGAVWINGKKTILPDGDPGGEHKLVNEMDVTLIDSMGSDLSVVNAPVYLLQRFMIPLMMTRHVN